MEIPEIEISISKQSTKALTDLTEQMKLLSLLSAETLTRIRELSKEMKGLPWYLRLMLALKG